MVADCRHRIQPYVKNSGAFREFFTTKAANFASGTNDKPLGKKSNAPIIKRTQTPGGLISALGRARPAVLSVPTPARAENARVYAQSSHVGPEKPGSETYLSAR